MHACFTCVCLCVRVTRAPHHRVGQASWLRSCIMHCEGSEYDITTLFQKSNSYMSQTHPPATPGTNSQLSTLPTPFCFWLLPVPPNPTTTASSCMHQPNTQQTAAVTSCPPMLSTAPPTTPQVLTFLAYRWMLWWWPVVHRIQPAAAQSTALPGVSVCGFHEPLATPQQAPHHCSPLQQPAHIRLSSKQRQ